MAENGERRRVVIAGGGVAGLETALALQALAPEQVAVELIAPEREFTYRPLAVSEPFLAGEVRRFPLTPLVLRAGAEFRIGAVCGVDPGRKRIELEDGAEVDYDVLVLALGAEPREAVSGAITFRGPQDGPAIASLLSRATAGELRRIVFAVPTAITWPLPLYELALLTAEYLADNVTRGVEVALATPEDRPLALFGPAASDAIRELLEIRGIALFAGVAPTGWDGLVLRLAGAEEIAADAVVALPALDGPFLAGVPHDHGGFVPTDAYGRVTGLTDVFAVGDLTQFPIKQGGLAAQQADAAATAIAADAGAPVEPTAFRPVLRGLLLTGMAPRFLRSETGTGASIVDTEPLWWPPAKIVGRHLAPFLAEHLGLSDDHPRPETSGNFQVEVELDPQGHPAWSPV